MNSNDKKIIEALRTIEKEIVQAEEEVLESASAVSTAAKEVENCPQDDEQISLACDDIGGVIDMNGYAMPIRQMPSDMLKATYAALSSMAAVESTLWPGAFEEGGHSITEWVDDVKLVMLQRKGKMECQRILSDTQRKAKKVVAKYNEKIEKATSLKNLLSDEAITELRVDALTGDEAAAELLKVGNISTPIAEAIEKIVPGDEEIDF